MPITSDDVLTLRNKLSQHVSASPRDQLCLVKNAMEYGYRRAMDELEADYAAKHAAYAQKVTDKIIDGEITVKFRPVFEVETS